MPAAISLGRLNQLLSSPRSEEYRSVKAAVDRATSCRDVADDIHLFEEQGEDIQAEGRTVLGAIVPEVDREILEVLRRALDREDVVVFAWEAAPTGSEIRVRAREDDGRAVIVIVSPDGRTL
jgi:hypothetical protein